MYLTCAVCWTPRGCTTPGSWSPRRPPAKAFADLRRVLIETVIARQAAVQRIGADVDAVAARFVPYAGDAEARARVRSAVPWTAVPGPAAPGRAALGPRRPAAALGRAGAGGGPAADGDPGGPDAVGNAKSGAGEAPGDIVDIARRAVPAAASDALAAAFCAAAGVSGVGRALQSARELKAVDYVGWPVAWLADRVLRRDPVRKVRLGTLWDELRERVGGSPPARSRLRSTTRSPRWPTRRAADCPRPGRPPCASAARSRTHDIPAALGAAIAESLPTENSVAPWWRAVAAWQGLLFGAAAVGVVWLLAIIVPGVFPVRRTLHRCCVTSACCRGSRSWRSRSCCSDG